MPRRRLSLVAERRLVVAAFLFVHVLLVVEVLLSPVNALGDVTSVYRTWVQTGVDTGVWQGLDTASVYPIVALVPMLLAWLAVPALGAVGVAGVHAVGIGWVVLVSALDAVAVIALLRGGRGPNGARVGRHAAWWWLGFLLLLGPVAIGRIDTVATDLAIVAVVVLARRPAVSAALLTIAAWIKVWPAALVAVLLGTVGTARRRWAVIGGTLGVTAVVVGVDVALGGGRYLLSFVTEQAGRGLTPASVLATPYAWAVAMGTPGTSISFDHAIIVFQVDGPGADVVAAMSTPLMIGLVLVVGFFTWRGLRRRVDVAELAPFVALALVLTLVVANKVGSPQYVGWIAVPIVWAMLSGGYARRTMTPAAVVAMPIAVMTQLLFPWFYRQMLRADPAVLTFLTARNLLEVALLGWTFVTLAVVATHRGTVVAPVSVGGRTRTATS
jgi:hypothetical protein